VTVGLVEFTDPACSYAWGTEPVGRATSPVMCAAAGTAHAGLWLLAVAATVVYCLALVIFHR